MIIRYITLLGLFSLVGTSPAWSLQKIASSPLHLSRLEYFFTDGVEVAKVLGTFKIVNSTPDELCVPKDIVVNELSPFSVVQDGQANGSVPNPPATSGTVVIKVGETLEFRRVVAFLRTGRKAHVSVKVFATKCADQTEVEFLSRGFDLTNR